MPPAGLRDGRVLALLASCQRCQFNAVHGIRYAVNSAQHKAYSLQCFISFSVAIMATHKEVIRMHIVALVTQKGGTGKSSLVVSLAVAAQERGQKAYIIDLDPQGTAKNWYERRPKEWPEVASVEPGRLLIALETLRKLKTDIVFVDTPGIDVPAATAAMQSADLCLIPARPSIADIEATRPTVRSLTRLGKSYAFVLNQCPPGRSIRTSDAYRVLQLSGAVAGATVGMRADHIDALAQGLGVTERDTNGKAAGEVRDLMQWIQTRLQGKRDGEKARVA